MKEFKMKINGNDYNVVVKNIQDNVAEVEVNGNSYSVEMDGVVKSTSKINRPVVTPTSPQVAAPASPSAPTTPSGGASGSTIISPLPGVIVDVCVKEGDSVNVGQKLLVLEAMKMENNINADRAGKILQIKVQKGDSVLEGNDLIIIG